MNHVRSTKYQEGCTKYKVPRLSRSKSREARSEMFEDKDCSSIQWFPTSTFCNRRSSFDISLDLVFRNSYFVFLLGTSYFVPCTVQFVFLYVISYPNNPIPLLPSCQLSIQGSCRKRYNRSSGSIFSGRGTISAA